MSTTTTTPIPATTTSTMKYLFKDESSNQLIEFGQDERKIRDHKLDSLNLLIFTFLLILVILTIWLFKHKRFAYIHETGLAIFYGTLFGIIIRYGFVPVNRKSVLLNAPLMTTNESQSQTQLHMFDNLPEYVILRFENVSQMFSYGYRGPYKAGTGQQDYEEKATFDPEIFFNILLPPIIFNAGYSMKRRHFFKNFGAILTFAFIGTTISTFCIGGIMYGVVSAFYWIKDYFSFTDCLYFGALVSATDPVTVLAIFNDYKVDVNLYALVFGESVLNDAVSIVLAQGIEKYSGSVTGDQFNLSNFFKSIGNFLFVFMGGLGIGSLMGCTTALLTKYTQIKQHSRLETALFILMSYSTFLASEAAGLTGIVAVLFCGIVQAHYTYNNLSKESQENTREFFQLLNFLSENFIFVYIGITMFTFRAHRWEAPFLIFGFLAIAIARAFNIYPLSFLLNLTRTNKITYNMQHMMFFSGLRGAMAFALAIRNTSTKARQLILTTTSIIVIITVIFCGGLTSKMLQWLHIRTGVEDDNSIRMDNLSRRRGNSTDAFDSGTDDITSVHIKDRKSCFKALMKRHGLFKLWHKFDQNYMKPLFTHSKPTLMKTLPACCLPVSRFLTTDEQLEVDTIEANGDYTSFKDDQLLILQNSDQFLDEHLTSRSNSTRTNPQNLLQMEPVSL